MLLFLCHQMSPSLHALLMFPHLWLFVVVMYFKCVLKLSGLHEPLHYSAYHYVKAVLII